MTELYFESLEALQNAKYDNIKLLDGQTFEDLLLDPEFSAESEEA